LLPLYLPRLMLLVDLWSLIECSKCLKKDNL
jgi:hypothetical protein